MVIFCCSFHPQCCDAGTISLVVGELCVALHLAPYLRQGTVTGRDGVLEK